MTSSSTAAPFASTTIRRFQAGLFPVNAYSIETRNGVVVVDATLGVSDGRALRATVEELGKPLLAVLVTHAHPDHYGALDALLDGLDTPVFAAAGVDTAIRRDDAEKDRILRPMFGDEWAHERRFPSRAVPDGERLTFDGASFRLLDFGPGESPHDSAWLLEGGSQGASDGPAHAFVGDLVYDHMHGYLADGNYEDWLGNIARARRELGPGAVLHMGHGSPGPAAPLLDWQEGYIRAFIGAVRSAAASGFAGDALVQEVTAAMKRYLPNEDLLFLMQLSVEPMRALLARATS